MEKDTLILCIECGFGKKSHPIAYKRDGAYRTCNVFIAPTELPTAEIAEVTIFVRCPNGALMKLVDPEIFILEDKGTISFRCHCGNCNDIVYRAPITRG